MNTLASSAGLNFSYITNENSCSTSTANPYIKIIFDSECRASDQKICISTGLQSLCGHTAEIIASDLPFRSSRSENCLWFESADYVVIALWANESNHDGLQNATEALYQRLHKQITELGYPHLIRIWNYFADINRIDNNLERYRQFCIGRFNAFESQGLLESQFPSACALGHGGGDLLVYALASKKIPKNFENPYQQSAYKYPDQYGPRSPSFARASVLEIDGQTSKIFVSGTASVVGFITQHPHDLTMQISVTLANLNHLLKHIVDECTKTFDGQIPRCTAEIIKVYIRNPTDLPEIQNRISATYPSVPTAFLVADICRADLLLELDGIWNLAL